MSFCQKCGSDVDPYEEYCPDCGVYLLDEEPYYSKANSKSMRMTINPPPPPPPPPDIDLPPPPPDYQQHQPIQRVQSRPMQYATAPSGTAQKTARKQKPSGNITGKIIAVCIVIFLILFFILPQFQPYRDKLVSAFNNLPLKSYREFPEETRFELNREITIRSYSAQSSGRYTLRISVPHDITNGNITFQDVQQLRPTPQPRYETPTTNNPNAYPEMMVWEDNNFRTDVQITVYYKISARTYKWEITQESSGTVNDIPDDLKVIYNHDEWLIDDAPKGILNPSDDIDHDGYWDYRIEPSNPQLQNLASQLTGTLDTVYEKVKAIYDYLTEDEHLHYVIRSGGGLPVDCYTTMQTWRGDCDDYSILFVALCRAIGVPAWLELGALYDSSTGEWVGHGWADVYIPLKTGLGIEGTVDIVNKEFLFRDSYRFTDWVDTGGDITYIDGIEQKTENNLDYYYLSFIYQGNIQKDQDAMSSLSFNKFGNKIRLDEGSNDLTGGGKTCLLPGFEAQCIIVGILFITGSRKLNSKF